ncbi:MAG: 4-hydroxy-tetrahydrodipicolinate reductase [Myxococcaceae bacterium]
MINVVITGVAGRMGSALVRVASASGLTVVGGTVRSTAGRDVGELAQTLGVSVSTTLPLDNTQVVIDFTSAASSVAHAKECATRGVPMVIGSTGFTPESKAQVAAAANKIPIVLAPNTSVGVNLVIQMAGQLAKVLGESFDVEIVETHHRMKKDAPSGTALRLAEEVARATGRTEKDFRTDRNGLRGAKDIGVQALRGGDVVGEHTVFFFGEGERVELTHRAMNRDQFARGAVRAALWVVKQSPGLYAMRDVLGL